jgi:ABC-2 type transport system ATP-binding protein
LKEDNLIEVQNLTKYYKDFCAVNNISLTIRKGEILGLLWPNGAGKTSALRMLTGYFRPSSGTIKVKDLQMPEDAIKIKSMIGYLPESAPLYHNMLVYDYLDYVAKIKGIHDREKRYDRLLQLSDMCGLGSIMGKPISDLSKGLRQRVGLAHAMMTDPEILILDEPTSGLDPNQIAEIRNIIKTIGREKTIIFSTHILSEAEATCDRIVIINRGRIVADDTTQHLKARAESGCLVRLSLRNVQQDEAETFLKSLDFIQEVKIAESGEDQAVTFEITGRDNRDIRPDLYLKIRETDWIILQMNTESQGLEKIFRELTREAA